MLYKNDRAKDKECKEERNYFDSSCLIYLGMSKAKLKVLQIIMIVGKVT